MLPLLLAAARTALPTLGRATATESTGAAARLLSAAQFGTALAHSQTDPPNPPTESNPVYTR
ncbi:hypothetical protein ADL22_12230 [Streptomyces sp. NRRL F-4489]|nr:hypothetical protein ADL22_12230 [Streptomyces sp. NRRL F-4489]